MAVKFEDHSIEVKAAMNKILVSFLHEAAGAIVSQAKRNSRVGKVAGGKTKGSWKYEVDEGRMIATVGSSEENALWEEFGTGEYALEGKGRKGGWYISIGNGSGQISESVVEAYNMKVVYGKDGKKFAYTKGKKPNRTLFRAFESKKNAIIRRCGTLMKGLNS